MNDSQEQMVLTLSQEWGKLIHELVEAAKEC